MCTSFASSLILLAVSMPILEGSVTTISMSTSRSVLRLRCSSPASMSIRVSS